MKACLVWARNSYQHFLYPRLIDFLAQPVGGWMLQAIEVTETISVYMRVALLAGDSGIPVDFLIVFQLLAKGLKPKERATSSSRFPSPCRGRVFAFL